MKNPSQWNWFRPHCVQQLNPYFNNKIKPALTPAPESEVIISREKAMDFKKWLGK